MDLPDSILHAIPYPALMDLLNAIARPASMDLPHAIRPPALLDLLNPILKATVRPALMDFLKPVLNATVRPALTVLILAAALIPSTARAQTSLPATLPAADLNRLEHTALTLDDLNRFLLTANDIAALARTNPGVQAIVNAPPRDLATTAQRVESEPALLTAVTAHQFTPDTFAVTEFAIFQTFMAVLAGADAKAIASTHVNPANLTLFQQHGPEIEALFHKLQQ